MSNFRDKRILDYVWEKWLQFVSQSGIVLDNPLAQNLVITEPLTLYVETTGSDSNPGTLAAPFKTVRGALELLRNTVIQNAVTIKLGLGTFDGFEVPTLQIESGPDALGSVTIEGTYVTLYTGTLTSTAFGILNDTTKNWTVDELKGKYVQVGSSTTYSLIHDNTATAATVLSGSSFTSGSSYTVVSLGTTILGNQKVSSTGMSAVSFVGRRPETSSSGPICLIRRLVLQAPATSSSSTVNLYSGDGISFAECDINAAFNGISGFAFGRLTLNRCRISLTTSNSQAINMAAGNTVIHSVSASWIVGTSLGGQTGIIFGGTGFSVSNGMLFENLGKAIWTQNYPVVGSFIGTFIGCTTCISIEHPSIFTIGDSKTNFPNWPFTSANNGTFISITHPSKIGVRSNIPSGLATTDLNVHGATSTLTAMRALSPAAFPSTPSAYGSVVYSF